MLELQATRQRAETLEKGNEALKEQLTSLSDKQRKEAVDGGGRRGKRRSMEDYSDRHLRRLKKARQSSCAASLSWLEREGYEPLKVVVRNKQTDATETLQIGSHESEHLLGQTGDSVTSDKLDMLNMILFVKDRCNVSGEAYHQLARICKELPRHWKLKRRIQELNSVENLPDSKWNYRRSAEAGRPPCSSHMPSSERPSFSIEETSSKAIGRWDKHRKTLTHDQFHIHATGRGLACVWM